MPRAYKSEKPWRDALRKAVNERGEDKRKRLELIAEKCVASAMAGEISAMREIGDRLDGKPAQALTGEDGGAIIVQIVKYAADNPKET